MLVCQGLVTVVYLVSRSLLFRKLWRLMTRLSASLSTTSVANTLLLQVCPSAMKTKWLKLTILALGSAGVTMKKICYGLALPGLCVTICIYTHVRRLLPPFHRRIKLMNSSFPQNTSLSASSAAAPTSPQTPSSTGRSGSPAPGAARPFRTSSLGTSAAPEA